MSYSPLPNPFAPSPPSEGQGGGRGGGGLFAGGGSWEIPGLRVAGAAPVFVHWSVIILFVFFGLMAWRASSGFDSLTQALVTVLSPLFFLLSILGHELGHAYAYHLLYNCWVTGIFLYAMGGFTAAQVDVSQMETRKSMMLVVAIAGPLVNGILAGILLGAYYGLGAAQSVTAPPVVMMLLRFHGWMQVFLFVYNMLPGVPLDGISALIGALRYCMTDQKARMTGYIVGVIVVLAAVVLCFIFFSLFAAIFLVMTLFYTGFALYELFQRPQSVTNPTY